MVLDALGDLDLERGDVRVVHLVRQPETGHRAVVRVGEVRAFEPLPALLRQRVQAGAEQGLHLLTR